MRTNEGREEPDPWKGRNPMDMQVLDAPLTAAPESDTENTVAEGKEAMSKVLV